MKKPVSILSYILPQPRDILFIGVFFVMVFGGPKLFANDGDLGRHLTIGTYILDTGTIPKTDIFSHTLYGHRLVIHEWFADVVLAFAHRVMGLSGDVFVAALLAALTILLVYNELIRRGNLRLVALFVSALVAIVSSVHWLARPHMFTYFFLALWTFWLERFYTGGNKHIWHFPLLMLVWANMHGAFFAGFVIWGVYAVEWFWEFLHGRGDKGTGRGLALIGLLSFAVTFINPSGWLLWPTSVGYVGNDFMTSHIVDHMSPNFHESDMWPFLFMIVLALFSLTQEHKLRLRDGLLLAGWTAMGLHTVRNLPLFAVVTAPIYGELIQTWVGNLLRWLKQDSGPREGEIVLHGYVWVVAAIAFFGVLLWRGVPLDQKGTGNVFLPDKMPVQAVAWLKQNPQPGNMFNDFAWGGYILYSMWPNEKVFIDGQTDFYGERLFRQYLDVIDLNSNWENVLDQYNVSWMLIPDHGVLAVYLKSDTTHAWKLIYEDDTAAIFRRNVITP